MPPTTPAPDRSRGSRGYTPRLEILVVLAIIALVASLIGFAVHTQLAKARLGTTRQSAWKIRQTVVLFRKDHVDECPTVDRLKRADLIEADSDLIDAWNEPFVVTCGERGTVHVSSAGPDRRHGSEDDIVATEPPPRSSL